MLLKSLSTLLLFLALFSSSFASNDDCGHLYAGDRSLICPGDTVVLRVTSGSDPWHWEDGISGNWLGSDTTLLVTQPGLYVAELDNGCASVQIWVLTLAEYESWLPTSDTFCVSGTYRSYSILNLANANFSWWDGNTSANRTFTEPGQYTYTINSNCGQINGTLSLYTFAEPVGDFPEETPLCRNASVELNLPVESPLWQRWSTNSYATSIVVNDTGTYSVELGFGNNCRYKYETQVVFDDCLKDEVDEDCMVTVPNVFTPNGDGINDAFRLIQSGCGFKSYRLDIYDRWGRPCFISENPEDQWRGGNHAAGVYYWRVSYQSDASSARPVQEAGALLLMR